MNKNEEKSNAMLQVFTYEGGTVSFAKGDNVMVNATEMAKHFGKRTVDWLQNSQTQEFIKALSEVRKSTSADLVQVTKGGAYQGTWMHEDVAIEFARWLSPKFAIWCNDRIKELAKDGVATISDDDEVIAHAISVLQKRLEAKSAQLQIAESTIEAQQDEIKQLAPLAEYTQDVLQSTTTYTFTQVGKAMGFTSVNTFICWLLQHKIIYRQSGQYMPTSKYAGKGLFATRTAKFFHKDGTVGTSLSTVITEKGRMFLQNLLNNNK